MGEDGSKEGVEIPRGKSEGKPSVTVIVARSLPFLPSLFSLPSIELFSDFVVLLPFFSCFHSSLCSIFFPQVDDLLAGFSRTIKLKNRDKPTTIATMQTIYESFFPPQKIPITRLRSKAQVLKKRISVVSIRFYLCLCFALSYRPLPPLSSFLSSERGDPFLLQNLLVEWVVMRELRRGKEKVEWQPLLPSFSFF